MSMPSGRRFTLAFVGVLAAAIAIAYSNSFNVGFQFDDWHTLQKNPAIRSLANIPRYFVDASTLTVLRENVDARPFLVVTYAVNYAISGLRPWSWHLVNLFIHLAAAMLVFFIVRDFLWWPPSERGPNGEGRLPAAAAALIFAVAPLNHEAIVYVSARSALLSTALYLGAFHSFLRRRWLLMGVLYALALLVKSIAITLPATVLLYDFIYRDRTRHRRIGDYLRDWRRLTQPLVVLGAVSLAFLAYRQAVVPSWMPETRKQSFITPGTWLMSEWSALLYYVRLFVWPDALSIDHDFPYAWSLLETRAWLPLLVILAWIGTALRVHLARPIAAFATLWFFVTLSVESSVFPLAEVVNEHRPYVASSLGLAVLASWLIYGASTLAGRRATATFVAVVAAVVLVAIPVTRHRNWVWQDSLRLWKDAAEKGPNNSRAWMNAGVELKARGDLVEARRYFERARAVGPAYAWVPMNMSSLLRVEGDLDGALREAQEAVRLAPTLALAHYYLGSAFEALGRIDEARAAYTRALEINPTDSEPQFALNRLAVGNAHTEMAAGLQALATDPEGAIPHFRKVLDMNPTHYGATYQLAAALDRVGRPGEARPLWEKTLAMARTYDDQETVTTAEQRLARPDEQSVEALMTQGLDALYKQNSYEAAITDFRRVLEQVPTHYGATYQLATALDRAGRPAEARHLWEKVLKMAEGYHDDKTAETARSRLEKTS
jgi:protein O-mannosyl-transferase